MESTQFANDEMFWRIKEAAELKWLIYLHRICLVQHLALYEPLLLLVVVVVVEEVVVVAVELEVVE